MAASKKLEARVQMIQKRPENKQCFSCGRPGLQQAVVFPFGIFVCATCSGMLLFFYLFIYFFFIWHCYLFVCYK